jgi:hypothetical protein
MSRTNAKTAIVACARVLLTAGTITIIGCNQEKSMQGIPNGWMVISGNSEQWNWTNGVIYGHSTTGESILASGKEYRDVTLSATDSTTNREASLAIRMQDANNGYIIIFAPSGTPRDDAGQIALLRKLSGEETILASYHGQVFSSMGQSAKVAVTARGPLIEVSLNDVRVLRVMDTTFSTGLIGLRIFGDADYPCDATFSKVTF